MGTASSSQEGAGAGPGSRWSDEWQSEMDSYPDYVVRGTDGKCSWRLWKKESNQASIAGGGPSLSSERVFPLENSQADAGKEVKVRFDRETGRAGITVHKWCFGTVVGYDAHTDGRSGGKHSIFIFEATLAGEGYQVRRCAAAGITSTMADII